MLAYKARCLEVYKRFRQERAGGFRDAVAVTAAITDAQLMNSQELNELHFGHAGPAEGAGEAAALQQHDNTTRETVYQSMIPGVRQLIVDELAALQRHLIQRAEAYLAVEFSNYLLVDGKRLS